MFICQVHFFQSLCGLMMLSGSSFHCMQQLFETNPYFAQTYFSSSLELEPSKHCALTLVQRATVVIIFKRWLKTGQDLGESSLLRNPAVFQPDNEKHHLRRKVKEMEQTKSGSQWDFKMT